MADFGRDGGESAFQDREEDHPRRGWWNKASAWGRERLPPVDLASYRIARHWVSLQGDEAEAEAEKMRESYRAQGDEIGEDIWTGILRAIALIRAVTFHPRRPMWRPAGAKIEP